MKPEHVLTFQLVVVVVCIFSVCSLCMYIACISHRQQAKKQSEKPVAAETDRFVVDWKRIVVHSAIVSVCVDKSKCQNL